MKNRIHLSLLLTAALVFLSACVKDELDASCRDDKGQFQLTLSIGDQEDVAITRSIASMSECQIHDLYLLVFDASTGFYKFGEQVVLREFLTGNGTATPKVTSNLVVKAGDKVVVLANTGQTATTVPLTVGVSTVADINAAFPSGNVIGTGTDKKWGLAPSSDGDKRPMSGEFVYTSPLQVQTCNLRSSVAKINVVFDPDLQDATGIFATSNIWFTVANSANYGHVYASPGTMSIPTSGMTFGTHPSLLEAPLSYSGPSADYGGPLLSRYIPEYNSSVRAKDISVTKTEFHKDRMCIILHVHINKSTTNLMYYRLDIATGNTAAETKEFLNIERNKHYMVTIKKVKSMGYTTPEEALSSPGSNLEYEIKATGDDDNVIVSNGQYAISLSNDITRIYMLEQKEVVIASGRIILPAGMANLPAGVTNTITMTYSGAHVDLLTTSLTTTDTPIKVLFKDLDHRSLTLTVKVGNITKTITIHRSRPLDAHYEFYNVSGSLMNLKWNEPVDWVEVIPQGLSFRIRTTKENVTPVRWVKVDDSGTETPSTKSDYAAIPIFEDRYAEGYILLSSGSRLKLLVQQKGPIYIGWFGGEPDNSNGRYGKRLICESVETAEWQWDTESNKSLNLSDKERGLSNTKILYEMNRPGIYQAAANCTKQNDVNSNGVITIDEPHVWYLPAQNQLMAAWITQKGFPIPFNDGNYWSSTEHNSTDTWCIGISSGTSHVSKTDVNRTRCVREL